MFTGIVAAVGRVVADASSGTGRSLTVDARDLDLADVAIGDSIAVSGCCLTVVALDGALMRFDLSAETLARTAGFRLGADVNLEKSLRLADRLGGHLVQGHVDGVGAVVSVAALPGDERNRRLEVDAPGELARFIAGKGSVAVDGVSLTVNGVEGTRFHVNLIPHTLAVTTLAELVAGSRVNLEVDMMARYAARLLEADANSTVIPAQAGIGS
jgi:riboflavin synthase